MQIIKRKDKTEFVIALSRLVVSKGQPTADIKREINKNAKEYGRFVNIRLIPEEFSYDIAFSKHPGYLLGESVAEHFKASRDLIFCEVLENEEDCALVVVRNGKIVGDSIISINNVPSELAILVSRDASYDLYLFGENNPVSKQGGPGKFKLKEKEIKTCNILSESLIHQLPKFASLRLERIDDAIKNSPLGKNPYAPIIILIVVGFSGYFGWKMIFDKPTAVQVKIVERAVTNPFKGYMEALQTPDPVVLVQQYMAVMEKLGVLRGWDVTQFEMRDPAKPNHIFLSVSPNKGATIQEAIDQLYELKDYRPSVERDALRGFFELEAFAKRPEPKYIRNLNEMSATLLDRLTHLGLSKYQLKAVNIDGAFATMGIKISFSQITLVELGMVAATLEGLPLTLQEFSAGGINGEWSGSIEVLVYGN